MYKGSLNNKALFQDLNDLIDVDKAKVKLTNLEAELNVMVGTIKDDSLRKTIFSTLEDCKKGKTTPEEVTNKLKAWL